MFFAREENILYFAGEINNLQEKKIINTSRKKQLFRENSNFFSENIEFNVEIFSRTLLIS